jgi:hypothetical protein
VWFAIRGLVRRLMETMSQSTIKNLRGRLEHLSLLLCNSKPAFGILTMKMLLCAHSSFPEISSSYWSLPMSSHYDFYAEFSGLKDRVENVMPVWKAAALG